jgi:hypothetical protein
MWAPSFTLRPLYVWEKSPLYLLNKSWSGHGRQERILPAPSEIGQQTMLSHILGYTDSLFVLELQLCEESRSSCWQSFFLFGRPGFINLSLLTGYPDCFFLTFLSPNLKPSGTRFPPLHDLAVKTLPRSHDVDVHASDLVGIDGITRVLIVHIPQQDVCPRGHILPLWRPRGTYYLVWYTLFQWK